MKRCFDFFVPGLPAPGGSKRGFRVGNHISIVEAGGQKTKNWRAVVALAASATRAKLGGGLLEGPVQATVMFYMPRPKGHFGSGTNSGKLKALAPRFPISKPDTTKLWRSTEDACTGILWKDDAQVVDQHVRKVYAFNEGMLGAAIRVEEV